MICKILWPEPVLQQFVPIKIQRAYISEPARNLLSTQ